MKIKPLSYLLSVLFAWAILITSCDEFIEPSISKKAVQLEAPADQYQSSSYTVNFWWDEVDHALTYRLQVVTPNFASPGLLVLDTVVSKNKFAYNLNPGQYQWRVMALNGSSQTVFSSLLNFTVIASSIKQQSVQLISPANNLLTNQSAIAFQWGSLYGATKYRFEIDTNSFANENVVISNTVIPGQQLNFTFPKDQVYQWRVRAENDTAQAKWSAVNNITYDHTPPPPVSLISPTEGQTVSLPASLQWGVTTNAQRYKLFVFKSDSTTLYNATFPMVVNTTSYSFGPGNSGDKVYWKVTAIDAAGNEGAASELRNFVVQ